MRGGLHGIDTKQGSRPKDFALPRWLVLRAAILALFALVIYSGALDPLERLLSDWRFKLAARPASQTLTVVEIDSASLHELDSWPWPRGYYATAIDNLRKAGARKIGFDVDLSGRADSAEDAKLAAAIAAGDGDIVLSTFMQPRRGADGQPALAEIQPEERLRKGIVLASINMVAESDGILRRGYYAFATGQGDRPSMAATLAGQAYARSGTYYIDFGIEESSIPRLSFADLLANKFDPELVRGRNILIGGTALELADEFAVPAYGIVPGVFLHALSYESILQGRTLVRPSLLLSLITALLVIVILDRRRDRWSWLSVLAPHCAVLAMGVGVPLLVQRIWPVSLDASPMLLAQFLCLGRTVGSELERRAREIFRQRAFNARQQALVTLAVKDSSDGIIVTDAEGRIELCNECGATMLGFKNPAAVAGSTLVELVPDFPIYPIERAPKRGNMLVPADCFAVVQGYTRGSRALEVSADWTLCDDPCIKEVQGGHIFVYTLRDVSARRRIEEAERDAKEKLIAASQAKSQFIHNMSHELRTPLNAVIGFSDMICRETAGPVSPSVYAGYVRHIREGGKNLLNVINDVLEVTWLESGNLELPREPIDLAQLIQDARSCAGSAAFDDAKIFTVDIPGGFPLLLVNHRCFTQALMHLFSNARKFTVVGGRIDVIARLGSAGEAIIEIRDDGIGVDRKHLLRLTEAFYQADQSLSRKHEGTGLGLYLITKYLALHNARLELESEVGKGFTARIVLPDAKAPGTSLESTQVHVVA